MIPEEAVEAVVKAVAERLAENEHGWVDADDLADMVIDVRDFDMRAAISSAIEAAAPYIAAEAWEQGRDAAERNRGEIITNPYRSQA